MLFRDRREAGKKLGVALGKFAGTDAVVLALPRGGVPVGFEVSQALHAPLDIFVVRKLGTPGQEELAMGAIASGGVRVLNRTIIDGLQISPEQIDAVAAREERELERREHAYRGDRGPLEVQGRVAILVDDGVATGSTMRAAVTALRQKWPREIVLAVPVASRYICDELQEQADETVCLYTPLDFFAVGQWYKEFTQISDDEVRALLERAAKQMQQRAAYRGQPRSVAAGSLESQKMNQPDESQPQPAHTQGEVEIAHNQWREYLDSFSREHLDWLVTVEVRSPEGRLVLVEQQPLKGVSLDCAEGLDRAYIQVGDGAEAHATHTIERPVRVVFKQSQSGAHEGLEIVSANSTTTAIRFRSAMKPEALDGVAA